MPKLRIGVIAHLRHPIAQPFAGGLEAFTHRLCQALHARGHAVTLVATGDSDPALPLLPALPSGYEARFPSAIWHDTPALHAWLDAEWVRIGGLLAALDVDVLHNNSLHPVPLALARDIRRPLVTTLHVPPFHTLREAVREIAAPWMLTALPSAAQVPLWWGEAPATAQVVPNGIDFGEFPYRAEAGDHAVWAGRIAPNKAPHLAALAAQAADVPLDLHGRVEDDAYFTREVAPLLGHRVRHLGHTPRAALGDAFGRAAVALFTPMWDEPFGLAAAEALACGTPVAAFDRGAAREVIGEAGALAPQGEVAALAEAIRVARRVPRASARARAERLFSEEAMLARYEALYARAIAAAAG